ncbi:MAG: DUF2844 domain-containing protein [Terriglobales bacterium]
MRKLLAASVLAVAIGLAAMAATPPQLPVLGQPLPPASAQSLTARRDLQQVGASAHEYTTPRGVALRAYAAANGTVFGLAWQGVTAPDFATILGSNYAAFEAAVHAQAPHHRGPLSIQVGNLVVQLGGHMRDLHGRAYLINEIPPQLSPSAVR